ncbi:hypothetical protein G9464_01870 [Halostella sp. JP-L12]|uniref:DUF5828 family protein n=1 Tax=Halostella TaxID=1843185 RepID=UPI000EF84499|nr:MULTISPECIES: DUF5828 family protein [Halostella]NHN46348.1 hypothetical protein [Halostella sp. JP-L12]
MEESISGFKVRGTWGDVVEHGERITRALRDLDVNESSDDGDEEDDYVDAFEEWNEWRPKPHEQIEADVSEKTAEQASVKEGKGEKAGKDPDEDIQTAGEKLTESYEKLEDDDTEGAVGKWGESLEYVARAADSAGRKALRAVEDTVYQRVMTQIAPYYFDNELVSANLQHNTNGDEETFTFEINVNDDALKEGVSERLAEYEDTVDRWHVDTERDTENVEAVEGVEAPEQEERSKPSSN